MKLALPKLPQGLLMGWGLSLLLLVLSYLRIAGNSKSTDYYARIGAGVGTFLVCAPMIYWFYAFTLSRKARTWFNWVPAPDAPR